MRKRTKILLMVIGAILALTVGLTTTIVLASSSSGAEGSGYACSTQNFTSKVAGILGLDEQTVADAFKQARQEMQDEALEQRLQEAVDSGRLAEDEADQIREWWQSRPSDALEEFGQPQLGNAWGDQVPQCQGRWRMGRGMEPPRVPGRGFEANVTCVNGTITAISQEPATITLTTAEDNEVTVQYTENTQFILCGATSVEVGQTAMARCSEDDEGNLIAKVVTVGLPAPLDCRCIWK